MILYRTCIIISIITFCISINYISAQKPIAYFTFDNTTNDFSGNNNNGIARGDIIPVKDRFNKPCSALHFDGISSFIEVPNSPTLESINKSFTFTVWYKFDNLFSNQWLTVFCKGKTANETNSNPQYRFQIQQSPSSNTTSCGTGIPTQYGFSTISFNTEFTKCDFDFKNHLFEINKWCFYALSYDGNTVNAYMDGVKIFSYNYNGIIGPNKESLFIGIDEPGSTEYFQGSLDDLRIFDVGLSDNDIKKFYNETRPIIPVAELHFQENLKYYLSTNECTKKINYPFPKLNDNCNNVKVKLIDGQASGSNFSVGINKVTYEVSENGGSTERNTFSIIILDTIKPIFTYIPLDTTIYIKEPENTISIKYIDPKARDNCGIKDINKIKGPSNGDQVKEGIYRVIYEAIDFNGNKSEAKFIINVIKKKNALKPEIPKIVRDTIKVYDTVKVFDRKTITDTIKVYDTIRPILNIKEIPILKLDSLQGRKNEVQNIIDLSSPKLKISLYDDAIVDGDTVTIYYNGVMILDKQLITDRPIDFEIEINENQDNELIMYANNLGTIPPNTGLLVFYDQKKRYEVGFKSYNDMNAKIIFRYSNKK